MTFNRHYPKNLTNNYMLEGNITFEQVTFIIAMTGVIFSIYHFFRNPDIKNNLAIQILQKELESQKDLSALALKTSQNEVHSVYASVSELKKDIDSMKIEITKLGTIIEERIPKKWYVCFSFCYNYFIFYSLGEAWRWSDRFVCFS